MAKINRYDGNVQAFAAESLSNERTVFGSETQDDTLDQNINADFLRGWGIVGVNENPTKQDFNAAFYTLSQLIAYLHQAGIPEWNAAQEVFEGSVVTTTAGIYRLKSGGDSTVDPDTDDGTNWDKAPTAQEYTRTFESVADLQASSAVVIGQFVRTLGYYEPGDGGGNDYEIVAAATGTDDGGSFIDLPGSGTQAKGLFTSGANILQFGVSDGEEFVVYVAPDGDDLNSGFSSVSPKATLQAANDALLGFRQPIQGKVAIEMAEGTYTDRANITVLTVDQLVVRGPDVGGHPNVPSAIIDLDGQTVETAIRGRPFTKAYLKNIKAQNVRGTYNSQGAFTCAENSNMDFENTHVNGCNGSGIYVSNLSRSIVYSGVYEDCNYGIEFYGESQGSIGRGAQSNSDAPKVIGASGNDAGIVIRRNSHVKISRAVVNGNNVSGYRGVFVNDSCTTHMTAGLIERCDTAVFAFPNSYALVDAPVELFRNDETRFNNQLFFSGPGSTIDYDGTDNTRSTEKLNKFSADEVSHTGTTTTTDLLDVAEILARDFYNGRAYRIELSGNLSGTGGTKALRVRVAGGGGNFVLLPFDASLTGRYRASFDIIAVDGTITGLASGVVDDSAGAVVRRSSSEYSWDVDATLSVAVTMADASDSVTIDYSRSFITGQ